MFGANPDEDPGPPPRRAEFADNADGAYEYSLAEILWAHGGIYRFTYIQAKRAEQLAELLCNPPDAVDRDRFLKFVDVSERLESRLPPARGSKGNRVPIVTANMSLEEQAKLYGRMIDDPTMFDDIVTVED